MERISQATLKAYFKVNRKGALNTDKSNPGYKVKSPQVHKWGMLSEAKGRPRWKGEDVVLSVRKHMEEKRDVMNEKVTFWLVENYTRNVSFQISYSGESLCPVSSQRLLPNLLLEDENNACFDKNFGTKLLLLIFAVVSVPMWPRSQERWELWKENIPDPPPHPSLLILWLLAKCFAVRSPSHRQLYCSW